MSNLKKICTKKVIIKNVHYKKVLEFFIYKYVYLYIINYTVHIDGVKQKSKYDNT